MKVTKAEDFIVYGKTVCPKCMFVESSLGRKNVLYKKVNLDHDEATRERLVDLGLMSLPVIEVHGEIISNHGEIMEYIESL